MDDVAEIFVLLHTTFFVRRRSYLNARQFARVSMVQFTMLFFIVTCQQIKKNMCKDIILLLISSKRKCNVCQ